MRLLTFQSELVADALLKGNDVKNKWGDDEPFCTFANLGYGPVSLNNIAVSWGYLMVQCHFPLDSVMLELEVPEEDILSMHQIDTKNPKEYTSNFVYISQKLAKTANNIQEPLECTVQVLNPEYLVAIHKYENGADYSVNHITTKVVNKKLCPLWSEELYFSGDGYIRDKDKNIMQSMSNYLKLAGTNCLFYNDYAFTIYELLTPETAQRLDRLVLGGDGEEWFNIKAYIWRSDIYVSLQELWDLHNRLKRNVTLDDVKKYVENRKIREVK